jgi:hypothetical protein
MFGGYGTGLGEDRSRIFLETGPIVRQLDPSYSLICNGTLFLPMKTRCRLFVQAVMDVARLYSIPSIYVNTKFKTGS